MTDVTLLRYAKVGCLALAGAMALAACGSDNSTTPSTGNSSSGAAIACGSGTLNTGGSSAQTRAVTAWRQAYQDKCGQAAINYDGQGSGYGVTQFTQGQFPLAGSDAALTAAQQGPANKRCATGTAIDLPMVITPVEFIYNVKGLSTLTLTPDILAKIFTGKITTWNDKEIAAANPGVTLPSTTIAPVHRSADSGTTKNFTSFLAAQAKQSWSFAPSTSWPSPLTSIGVGGKDSSALVQQVKSTDGGIGYVDGPDATANQLTPASLDTGSGAVAPSADSVGKAVAAATVKQDGQDIKVTLNYGLKQASAYPAVLVTYEITCTTGLPADQATLVKTFLTYTASSDGQAKLSPVGYSPLPADLLGKVQAAIAQLS